MPRSRRQNPWNEVIGLVALGIGTVVFLALISYNPGDVPSWVWFSYKSPPNNPTQNFIGPTGAIVAGFLYLTLGAAAYLVASLFLGFGVAKLFLPGFRILRRLPWALLFVVSGAALTQLQPWFLRSWEQQFKLLGPGGMLGYWVGAGLFQNALGKIGSIVALICIYLVSLVWLTGIRPVAIVKQIFSGMRALARQAATEREQKRLAAADERGRLELDQRKIEREIKKQERELKKKGVSIPEEPAVPRPEPKVFDTVAAPSPPKKPSRPAPPPKPAEEVYELPGVDLFDPVEAESRKASDPAELKEIQAVLVDTLKQFNIDVAPGDITRGPTITRYEVYPARGVRVDRITSLERDLARATRAERINILAPIPGKDTVGIELANTRKVTVKLREMLQSPDWEEAKGHAKIPLAFGKDVYGKAIITDLAQMPHLLVAGTTGSGKSVCINALIASMLFRFTPEELRFVVIDPKMVELQAYQSLPHLLFPIVTDPKKVLLALRGLIDEMERRYRMFARVGVRNIVGFNARPKKKKDFDEQQSVEAGVSPAHSMRAAGTAVTTEDEVPDRIPYVVVIIDELADLMQTAPADVETAIARITQMARAAGMHVIVATQTPRADVITGVIKANIPCRIAFQVASKIDSRVILDENGAERLLGQGDMLYLPPSASRLIRAQGVLVTDNEIHGLVEFVSKQSPPAFDTAMHEKLQSSGAPEEEVTAEDEELVEKFIEIIRQEKRASTSLLQRRLRLGYTRAARIVDILEQRGILGPGEGAKPREILVDLDAAV